MTINFPAPGTTTSINPYVVDWYLYDRDKLTPPSYVRQWDDALQSPTQNTISEGISLFDTTDVEVGSPTFITQYNISYNVVNWYIYELNTLTQTITNSIGTQTLYFNNISNNVLLYRDGMKVKLTVPTTGYTTIFVVKNATTSSITFDLVDGFPTNNRDSLRLVNVSTHLYPKTTVYTANVALGNPSNITLPRINLFASELNPNIRGVRYSTNTAIGAPVIQHYSVLERYNTVLDGEVRLPVISQTSNIKTASTSIVQWYTYEKDIITYTTTAVTTKVVYFTQQLTIPFPTGSTVRIKNTITNFSDTFTVINGTNNSITLDHSVEFQGEGAYIDNMYKTVYSQTSVTPTTAPTTARENFAYFNIAPGIRAAKSINIAANDNSINSSGNLAKSVEKLTADTNKNYSSIMVKLIVPAASNEKPLLASTIRKPIIPITSDNATVVSSSLNKAFTKLTSISNIVTTSIVTKVKPFITGINQLPLPVTLINPTKFTVVSDRAIILTNKVSSIVKLKSDSSRIQPSVILKSSFPQVVALPLQHTTQVISKQIAKIASISSDIKTSTINNPLAKLAAISNLYSTNSINIWRTPPVVGISDITTISVLSKQLEKLASSANNIQVNNIKQLKQISVVSLTTPLTPQIVRVIDKLSGNTNNIQVNNIKQLKQISVVSLTTPLTPQVIDKQIEKVAGDSKTLQLTSILKAASVVKGTPSAINTNTVAKQIAVVKGTPVISNPSVIAKQFAIVKGDVVINNKTLGNITQFTPYVYTLNPLELGIPKLMSYNGLLPVPLALPFTPLNEVTSTSNNVTALSNFTNVADTIVSQVTSQSFVYNVINWYVYENQILNKTPATSGDITLNVVNTTPYQLFYINNYVKISNASYSVTVQLTNASLTSITFSSVGGFPANAYGMTVTSMSSPVYSKTQVYTDKASSGFIQAISLPRENLFAAELRPNLRGIKLYREQQPGYQIDPVIVTKLGIFNDDKIPGDFRILIISQTTTSQTTSTNTVSWYIYESNILTYSTSIRPVKTIYFNSQVYTPFKPGDTVKLSNQFTSILATVINSSDSWVTIANPSSQIDTNFTSYIEKYDASVYPQLNVVVLGKPTTPRENLYYSRITSNRPSNIFVSDSNATISVGKASSITKFSVIDNYKPKRVNSLASSQIMTWSSIQYPVLGRTGYNITPSIVSWYTYDQSYFVVTATNSPTVTFYFDNNFYISSSTTIKIVQPNISYEKVITINSSSTNSITFNDPGDLPSISGMYIVYGVVGQTTSVTYYSSDAVPVLSTNVVKNISEISVLPRVYKLNSAIIVRGEPATIKTDKASTVVQVRSDRSYQVRSTVVTQSSAISWSPIQIPVIGVNGYVTNPTIPTWYIYEMNTFVTIPVNSSTITLYFAVSPYNNSGSKVKILSAGYEQIFDVISSTISSVTFNKPVYFPAISNMTLVFGVVGQSYVVSYQNANAVPVITKLPLKNISEPTIVPQVNKMIVATVVRGEASNIKTNKVSSIPIIVKAEPAVIKTDKATSVVKLTAERSYAPRTVSSVTSISNYSWSPIQLVVLGKSGVSTTPSIQKWYTYDSDIFKVTTTTGNITLKLALSQYINTGTVIRVIQPVAGYDQQFNIISRTDDSVTIADPGNLPNISGMYVVYGVVNQTTTVTYQDTGMVPVITKTPFSRISEIPLITTVNKLLMPTLIRGEPSVINPATKLNTFDNIGIIYGSTVTATQVTENIIPIIGRNHIALVDTPSWYINDLDILKVTPLTLTTAIVMYFTPNTYTIGSSVTLIDINAGYYVTVNVLASTDSSITVIPPSMLEGVTNLGIYFGTTISFNNTQVNIPFGGGYVKLFNSALGYSATMPVISGTPTTVTIFKTSSYNLILTNNTITIDNASSPIYPSLKQTPILYTQRDNIARAGLVVYATNKVVEASHYVNATAPLAQQPVLNRPLIQIKDVISIPPNRVISTTTQNSISWSPIQHMVIGRSSLTSITPSIVSWYINDYNFFVSTKNNAPSVTLYFQETLFDSGQFIQIVQPSNNYSRIVTPISYTSTSVTFTDPTDLPYTSGMYIIWGNSSTITTPVFNNNNTVAVSNKLKVSQNTIFDAPKITSGTPRISVKPVIVNTAVNTTNKLKVSQNTIFDAPKITSGTPRIIVKPATAVDNINIINVPPKFVVKDAPAVFKVNAITKLKQVLDSNVVFSLKTTVNKVSAGIVVKSLPDTFKVNTITKLKQVIDSNVVFSLKTTVNKVSAGIVVKSTPHTLTTEKVSKSLVVKGEVTNTMSTQRLERYYNLPNFTESYLPVLSSVDTALYIIGVTHTYTTNIIQWYIYDNDVLTLTPVAPAVNTITMFFTNPTNLVIGSTVTLINYAANYFRTIPVISSTGNSITVAFDSYPTGGLMIYYNTTIQFTEQYNVLFPAGMSINLVPPYNLVTPFTRVQVTSSTSSSVSFVKSAAVDTTILGYGISDSNPSYYPQSIVVTTAPPTSPRENLYYTVALPYYHSGKVFKPIAADPAPVAIGQLRKQIETLREDNSYPPTTVSSTTITPATSWTTPIVINGRSRSNNALNIVQWYENDTDIISSISNTIPTNITLYIDIQVVVNSSTSVRITTPSYNYDQIFTVISSTNDSVTIANLGNLIVSPGASFIQWGRQATNVSVTYTNNNKIPLLSLSKFINNEVFATPDVSITKENFVVKSEPNSYKLTFAGRLSAGASENTSSLKVTTVDNLIAQVSVSTIVNPTTPRENLFYATVIPRKYGTNMIFSLVSGSIVPSADKVKEQFKVNGMSLPTIVAKSSESIPTPDLYLKFFPLGIISQGTGTYIVPREKPIMTSSWLANSYSLQNYDNVPNISTIAADITTYNVVSWYINDLDLFTGYRPTISSQTIKFVNNSVNKLFDNGHYVRITQASSNFDVVVQVISSSLNTITFADNVIMPISLTGVVIQSITYPVYPQTKVFNDLMPLGVPYITSSAKENLFATEYRPNVRGYNAFATDILRDNSVPLVKTQSRLETFNDSRIPGDFKVPVTGQSPDTVSINTGTISWYINDDDIITYQVAPVLVKYIYFKDQGFIPFVSGSFVEIGGNTYSVIIGGSSFITIPTTTIDTNNMFIESVNASVYPQIYVTTQVAPITPRENLYYSRIRPLNNSSIAFVIDSSVSANGTLNKQVESFKEVKSNITVAKVTPSLVIRGEKSALSVNSVKQSIKVSADNSAVFRANKINTILARFTDSTATFIKNRGQLTAFTVNRFAAITTEKSSSVKYEPIQFWN